MRLKRQGLGPKEIAIRLGLQGHHCHARGCNVAVKPELLMCGRHWRMVPKAIQQAVWRYYRPGQCDDKRPSKDWHKAAGAAIAFVAKAEGRKVSRAEQAAFTEWQTAEQKRKGEMWVLPNDGSDAAAGSEDAPVRTFAEVARRLKLAPEKYDPEAHGAACSICPLKGATVVPPAPAKGRLRLIVVGEGPGRVEAQFGEPFIGPSGKLLDRLLEEQQPPGLRLTRSKHIHVTNAMLCRGENDSDNNVAQACCAPRLLKELAALNSVAPLMLLGKAAAVSVLGVRSILMARGFVWNVKEIEAGAVRAAKRDYDKKRGRLGEHTRRDKNAGNARRHCGDGQHRSVSGKRGLTSDVGKAVWGALVADRRNVDQQIVCTSTRGRRKKAPEPKSPEVQTKARVKWLTLKYRRRLAGRTAFPTIHPAFVIRADTWNAILQIDFQRAFRLLARLEKDERPRLWDEGPYALVGNATAFRRATAGMGSTVACDVETDGVIPLETVLFCIGVSDGKKTVVFDPRRGRGYPPKWRGENAAAVAEFFAGAGLQKRRPRTTVFHNGYNFDQIVMEARLGLKLDDSQIEDTLIAHHSYAAHLPQRLDQVVSTYVDSGPWKIRFGRRGIEEKGIAPHSMERDECAKYNAADNRLTIRAWHALQADLDPERAVYEHDKKLSAICRQMHIDGIRMDVKRRDYLSHKMDIAGKRLRRKMRQLTGRRDFEPAKVADVRWGLFTKFKAPSLNPTKTGLPSTSAATLEYLGLRQSRAGALARVLTKWRVLTKVRGTYLDAIQTGKDGRVHYNWKPYGTVSGRWSCRIQSIPKGDYLIKNAAGKTISKPKRLLDLEARARELYIPDDGHEFVYFDLSQSEMRAAAYMSGDENFIATCESGDVHSGNACILFPDYAEIIRSDPKGEGKKFRDITKNAGFGIIYSAEIETIFAFLQAHGFPVTFSDVQKMFELIHDKYATYYRYCEGNLLECRAQGFMRTALMGRIRWIGWHPKPGDVYNFPIQSFIADLMNLRLVELEEALTRIWGPPLSRAERAGTRRSTRGRGTAEQKRLRRPRVVAQIHDALILEVKQGRTSEVCQKVVRRIWDKPIRIPHNGKEFVMPIDLKVAGRWSHFDGDAAP